MSSPTTELYREVILDVLREAPEGLTADDVFERVAERMEDASPRGVRNTLNKLSRGKGALLSRLRARTEGRGAPPFVYLITEASPTRSQAGLFDALEGVVRTEIHPRDELEAQEIPPEERYEPTVFERIARSHVNEDRFARAVRQNATDVAAQDPVELIVRFARWFCDDINALAKRYVSLRNQDRDQEAAGVLRDLDDRHLRGRRLFHRLFRLDLPGDTSKRRGPLDIPRNVRSMINGEVDRNTGEIIERRASLDEDAARVALGRRIRGNRLAEIRRPDPDRHRAAAGSDASVADIYLEHAPGSFIPPDPVSVMTAGAALVNRDNGHIFPYQHFDIFPEDARRYGELRAAEEGLVLSPLIKGALGEGDFKHTRLAAMDLRQYAAERRIPARDVHWHPRASEPALDHEVRPTLLVRDGRIFPLVHRLRDFDYDNLYGRIVRGEIRGFRDVFHNTVMREPRPVTYAGAVKNTELSWLATLVFFRLYEVEAEFNGERVVEADQVLRPPFPDIAIAHLLFHGLAIQMSAENKSLEPNAVFCTCRAVRRFSDIAVGEDMQGPPFLIDENRCVREDSMDDWVAYVEQHTRRREEENRSTLPLDDYNDFIFLCARAAVSMTYAMACLPYQTLLDGEGVGHFLLPRLEVAFPAHDQMDSAEEERLDSMLSWLCNPNGWEFDIQHTHSRFDMGTGGPPVIVPDVVFYAHEAVTAARDLLEPEVMAAMRKLVAELRQR